MWEVLEAAIMRLRAEAGDAHETAVDVEEWQQHMLARLGAMVDRAGHPTAESIAKAFTTGIELYTTADLR
ncbi:MAG: hypothetical protein DI590_16650 [Methylorubrum populi]|nr:MAG: hypothetical protein DI590_16650 [Methylorubrum populi]